MVEKMTKIKVLLPVYNEGESIYNLLKKFDVFFNSNNISHEVIIINDFSSDNSENFINKAEADLNLKINYIKHSENKGLHGVLETGFKLMTDIKENDILVTMDGDNTHDPFLISQMLNKINKGSDIVIASRYCKGSEVHGLSMFREFLSIGARFLYKFRWNIKGVKDYTCNFRAYKGLIIKKMIKKYGDELITEQGFTAVTEILKKANSLHPTIEEVPMILVYSNKLQQSNMNIFKTILQTLKILIK